MYRVPSESVGLKGMHDSRIVDMYSVANVVSRILFSSLKSKFEPQPTHHMTFSRDVSVWL